MAALLVAKSVAGVRATVRWETVLKAQACSLSWVLEKQRRVEESRVWRNPPGLEGCSDLEPHVAVPSCGRLQLSDTGGEVAQEAWSSY